MSVLVSFLFAYLLGSIPFGLILTKAAGLGDIRQIGSGNIGATNVLRTGNKKVAAATLLLDGLKGAIAVLVIAHFTPTGTDLAEIAAIGAMLGHLFPVWLKFKGGKGVATGIGVIAALCFQAGVVVAAIWLLIAWRVKISSLAALVAFGFAPLDVMLFNRTDLAPFALLITLMVYFTHRENIRRLLHHTEPKIGHK